MTIELLLYASLSQYLPEGSTARQATIHLSEGSTVRALMQHCGIPESAVKLIFVDGVRAHPDTVLAENNRVGLFPPVGGG